MDILDMLKDKLTPDQLAQAKDHMDNNGGMLPDWVKGHAGDILDKLPFGLGDRIGDALGVETAADRNAAVEEETTEENQ